MEMAKVTSKGQITIPVSIRRRLQINEGDKLLFIDRPDGVMMVNPDLLGSDEDIDTAAEFTPKPETPRVAAAETKSAVKTTRASQLAANAALKRDPASVGDLNLDSLLDEIRSIGLKV